MSHHVGLFYTMRFRLSLFGASGVDIFALRFLYRFLIAKLSVFGVIEQPPSAVDYFYAASFMVRRAGIRVGG